MKPTHSFTTSTTLSFTTTQISSQAVCFRFACLLKAMYLHFCLLEASFTPFLPLYLSALLLPSVLLPCIFSTTSLATTDFSIIQPFPHTASCFFQQLSPAADLLAHTPQFSWQPLLSNSKPLSSTSHSVQQFPEYSKSSSLDNSAAAQSVPSWPATNSQSYHHNYSNF